MRPYSKYKPSGVPWLGDVPEHWVAKKVKHVSRCLDGIRVPLNAVERGERQGVIPYWGANAIVDWVNECLLDEPLVLLGEDGAPFFDKYRPVAFAVDGPIWPNNHIHVLRPEDGVCTTYLAYYLNCVEYMFFVDGSTRDKLTQTQMTKIPLYSPPPTEQTAIAAYLDTETARIDTLVAEKEKLIGLLGEARMSTITRLITGEDLPGMSSGNPWVPHLPDGWQLKRLKHLAEVRSGLAKGKDYGNRTTIEMPYLRVANVQDGYLNLTEVLTIEVAADEAARYLLQSGDVLMNEGGDYDKLGRGAVWSGEVTPCIHQNHVFAVRPYEDGVADWLAAASQTRYAKFYFMSNAKQSTNLASISQTNVKELPVVLPPPEVRKNRLAQLRTDIQNIDGLVAHVAKEIELLRELRAATITDAVLGRIDLHGYQHNNNLETSRDGLQQTI